VLSIICINSEVPIVHVLRQFHKVAGEVTTPPLLLMTSLPLQIILYLDHKVAAILWTNDFVLSDIYIYILSLYNIIMHALLVCIKS